jgi:hypothetical protein
MNKLALFLAMSLLLISCGKKDAVVKTIKEIASVKESLAIQGCSAFYLEHPEVEIAISCEDGTLWVLKHDGNFLNKESSKFQAS